MVSRSEFLRTHYKHLDSGRKRRDAMNPRREMLLVEQALAKLNLRYWKYIEINNPLYTNRKGEVIGGQQWIDFVVRGTDGRLFAIEFYPKWGIHNPHKYQLAWMAEKKDFLSQRGIGTLILMRNESSQTYQGRIYIYLHTTHRRR